MSGEAERLYYSISEVCEMTGLRPHVLRYWETAFPMLRPQKNQAGNRVYREKDIRLIRLIQKLLHEDRFTMDGARIRLEEMKNGVGQMELEISAGGSAQPGSGMLDEILEDLRGILSILDRDPTVVDGSRD
ncbi:MerR family transcriptional regulator [Candidatus Fermentibacterales bacterium]|nr:MerR family transcriptional regulator [Candidatus Fermentibacterales bacterium]